MMARACFFHREDRQKKKLTRKNKRPVGHIAHMNLSNNSHNKPSFMESYTKYLNSLVEQILYRINEFSKFPSDFLKYNIELLL